MSVSLSPYELIRHNGERRQGYLLRLKGESGHFGYGDIFPWPEFGDPKPEDIPSLVVGGKMSPLLMRSFELAQKDAELRRQQVPTPQILLRNHFLLSSKPQSWLTEVETAFSQGFTTIKAKVGRDFASELKALLQMTQFQSDIPWIRLDFNSKAKLEYFQALEPIKELIEFVEDPFVDPALWLKLKWPWAFDQPLVSADDVAFNFRIIKPAKLSFKNEPRQQNNVFTSYLDHPVGVAHALLEAIDYGPQSLDYGLFSLDQYQSTSFHEFFNKQGASLGLGEGLGIGFDDLLENQRWDPL